MEIFLEFVVAIAFSLIFSFFLAKIFSFSPSRSTNCDYDLVSGLKPCKHFIQKVVTCEPRGSETEKTHGFVAKVVAGESETQAKILFGDCCGSCDDVKIDDNEVLEEVEMERVVEEQFGEFGGACVCGESDNFAKFGTDLTKNEVGVARREEVEFLESKCEANEIQKDDGGKCSIFDCKEILMDKNTVFESVKIAKFESESAITEVGMARSEEIEVLESNCDNEIGEGNKDEEDDVKVVLFDDDDDWEGIERTELERLFGAAVAFVGNKCNADRISSIGSDLKMQLYGLHKIATVGPCHEPQPMVFKVSARANWNAWKQLGNMTPEIAMEQYVIILSRSILGCIQDDIGGDIKQVSADAEACSKLVCDIKAYHVAQLGAVNKRNVDELMPRPEGFYT